MDIILAAGPVWTGMVAFLLFASLAVVLAKHQHRTHMTAMRRLQRGLGGLDDARDDRPKVVKLKVHAQSGGSPGNFLVDWGDRYWQFQQDPLRPVQTGDTVSCWVDPSQRKITRL